MLYPRELGSSSAYYGNLRSRTTFTSQFKYNQEIPRMYFHLDYRPTLTHSGRWIYKLQRNRGANIAHVGKILPLSHPTQYVYKPITAGIFQAQVQSRFTMKIHGLIHFHVSQHNYYTICCSKGNRQTFSFSFLYSRDCVNECKTAVK